MPWPENKILTTADVAKRYHRATAHVGLRKKRTRLHMEGFQRDSIRALDLRTGGLRDSLLQACDNPLQLLQSTVLLLGLTSKSLEFVTHIDAILLIDLEVKSGVFDVVALPLSSRKSRKRRSSHAIHLGRRNDRKVRGRAILCMHMAATKMFLQILLTREPVASTAVAVDIGAHQRLLDGRVFLVDFALVAEETTRVRESLNFITSGLEALVGTIMLVHVFTEHDALAVLNHER